jgi:hypothetical protein
MVLVLGLGCGDVSGLRCDEVSELVFGEALGLELMGDVQEWAVPPA